jgi:beta-mannosidase
LQTTEGPAQGSSYRLSENNGATEVIPLWGKWDFSSVDNRYSGSIDIPGTVFSVLESQGEFGKEGIFYRENNRTCLEVADSDFIFKRAFIIDPSQFLRIQNTSSHVFLEADGLDTLAKIIINGQIVGETANMHRRYAFNIKKLLKPGENAIEIYFSNTLEYIRREQPKRNLWHAYWDEPNIAFHGFNIIRKSHCSYGWDWGPIVPDIGIWRKIQISIYRGAKINNIQVLQDHSENRLIL